MGGEEADSIFEQAALGHKFEDADVSISSSSDEYDDQEDEDENGEEEMAVDQSLKP